MKRLILFLAFIPVFAFAQAPDYDVQIITEAGDTTYTLELIDKSNPNADFETVNRRSGLTIEQVRTFFYERKERALSKKGAQMASVYVTDRLLGQIASAITQAGGDFSAWSQAKTTSQGTFDGIYQYVVPATQTNVEVKIEGLEVRNNANDNLLGTLVGELSPQYLNVQVGVDVVTLTGFSGGQFFGLRNGNLVVLTKTGDLPEAP